MGRGLREHLPVPERSLGEDEVRRAFDEDDEDRRTVRFPPYLRKLFASLDEAETDKLKKLLSLRSETIAWIHDKNSRELTQLDGAVEFITSSRTAAKVLMWCCGTAVAFVGGVVALAKNGIDFFALIRGAKP